MIDLTLLPMEEAPDEGASKESNEGIFSFDGSSARKERYTRILQEILYDLETFDEEEKEVEMMTAADLMDEDIPEVEWLVDGIIRPGLTVLGGGPKSGKSRLMLQIAVCCAQGRKVFDFFETRITNSLLIQFEGGKADFKENLIEISKLNDIPRFFFECIHLPKKLRIGKLDMGGMYQIVDILSRYPQVKLIGIDTMGRAFDTDNSSSRSPYYADYNMLEALQRFAIELDLYIVLLHHTSKGKRIRPIDEILGTQGISATADNVLILMDEILDDDGHYRKGYGKRKKIFYSIGRKVKEQKFIVKYDSDTMMWKIIKEIIEDEETEHNPYSYLSPEQINIIDLFNNDFSLVLKANEIVKRLNEDPTNVSHKLRKLVHAGFLFKPKTGHYQLVNLDDY